MSPDGRPKTDGAAPKILLIRLRRIGDIVMTTPAVALLKRRRPAAALTYVVEEPYRRLVERNPALDRVLVVPAKQKRSEFLIFLRDLRREPYDALLDFHGGPRASWMALAARAGTKIGYEIEHKRFLYDTRVPRQGPQGAIHSVENHANLVRALGIDFTPSEIPPLDIPDAAPQESGRVAALLREGGTGNEKLLVLHVGAGNRFRDWGSPRLAVLIALLSRIPGLKIATIGGEADREAESLLRQTASDPILPLAGRLNLAEVKDLIGRAALFVGPDSGPMHIAAATATPIVAYFGPTLPAHFAPWRPGGAPVVILETSLACRPCPQRTCVTNDFRCLNSIAPEAVFEACRPFLL